MPATSPLTALAGYKQLIDADIAAYSTQLLNDVEHDFTHYSRQALEAYCAVLSRGGKRLRGALCLNAYKMAGGTDMAMAVTVARALEMVNAGLLIIDDVADRSGTRRGGPTAHVTVSDHHKDQALYGDAGHFGEVVAVSAALVGNHLALAQLGRLNVPAEVRLALVNNLNGTIVITSQGQINDFYNEAVRAVDEIQVRRMLTWKSAYYTFLNPLQMGLLLGGADAADIATVKDYAMHLGLAFQVTDDILGTFGDEFESGKSIQDDIKEGKITLLVARALARANPAQHQVLTDCLGNSELTPADHEAAKRVLEETGALDYARQVARREAQVAVESLAQLPREWSGEGVEFLRDIAQFVTSRSS